MALVARINDLTTRVASEIKGLRAGQAVFVRWVTSDAEADALPAGTVALVLTAAGAPPAGGGGTVAPATIVRTLYNVGGADSTALSATPALTFTAPVIGHLLITSFTVDKIGHTIQAPTGWTLVDAVVATVASGVTQAVAYKISDGTETSVTWLPDVARRRIQTLTEITLQGATLGGTYMAQNTATSLSVTPPAATAVGIAIGFSSVDSWDTGWSTTGPTWTAYTSQLRVAEVITSGTGSPGVSVAALPLAVGTDPSTTVTIPTSDEQILRVVTFFGSAG